MVQALLFVASAGLMIYAERQGTTVKLMSRDMTMATVMVMTKSRNNSAESPVIRKKGIMAAILVSVEAINAPVTSRLPLWAAALGSGESFWCRVIFSSMTTALSTSMPTAITSPPNENIFRVRSDNPIRMNVPRILTGTAMPIISVLFILCRKNQMARIASRPPTTADEPTLLMELVM